MTFVYVFFNGGDPEDMIIFLTKEDAIDASLKYPDARIEVFQNYNFGHQMAYMYYKNGKLYEAN